MENAIARLRLLGPIVVTAVFLATIEVARQSGKAVPTPFLLVYLCVVVGGCVGGRLTGTLCGALSAGFVAYAAFIGFGPTTLTGGVLQATFGIALYVATGYGLGKISDSNRTLIGKLKLSETKLNQTVEMRTAELKMAFDREQETLAKLRHSQRLDALGQLSGGIAHDFNNLLGVVTGQAELLQLQLDKDDAEGARISSKELVTSCLRGAALTGRLLSFSRLQKLNPEVISTVQLIDGISEMLMRTLGEDILIEVSVANHIRPIYADRVELENAILNIAVNARQAMPDGGKLVIEADDLHVESDSELILGDYVRLRIHDDGVGMDPAVLQRAFDPFFTTKSRGVGTGLGLSVVHGFLAQSNGTISIESRSGRGTTVTIMLPSATESPCNAVPCDELPDEKPEFPSGVGRILLVEDNAAVLNVMSKTLAEAGYTVTTAESGEEALQRISEERFDLLFTDVGLPRGINGFQLAEQARSTDHEMSVLFTSGYVENSLKKRGVFYDAEVLWKPVRRNELLRSVRQRLQAANR